MVCDLPRRIGAWIGRTFWRLRRLFLAARAERDDKRRHNHGQIHGCHALHETPLFKTAPAPP